MTRLRAVAALLATAGVLAIGLAVAGCGEKAEPDVTPSGPKASIIERLREGGHVLVFRHATTESTTDIAEDPSDCARQRNLDDRGRRESRMLGAAVRALGVPVGEVRASPLCRTRETAELAFGRVRIDRRLISPGLVGTAADDRRRVRALRAMAATPPRRGNTVLVTHTGNVGGAFEESLLEAEALVFRPAAGGRGEPRLVGRLSLEDWERLRER